jgi:hypothetical protein
MSVSKVSSSIMAPPELPWQNGLESLTRPQNDHQTGDIVLIFFDRLGRWLGHGGHSFRRSAENLGFEGSQLDSCLGTEAQGRLGF